MYSNIVLIGKSLCYVLCTCIAVNVYVQMHNNYSILTNNIEQQMPVYTMWENMCDIKTYEA